MKRKAVVLADEYGEPAKDAAAFFLFGSLALIGDFVGSLSEEAYLYGNAAQVLAGIAATVRAFVVFRDWQARRDKIAHKKMVQEREAQERARLLEKEERIAANGRALVDAKTPEELYAALRKNDAEKSRE